MKLSNEEIQGILNARQGNVSLEFTSKKIDNNNESPMRTQTPVGILTSLE
ncbi:MAG: hypothetical protein Q4G03_09955 [Planctomycetia bacterium]|nr:hypothetical protein [Planctomycetia bacterium]